MWFKTQKCGNVGNNLTEYVTFEVVAYILLDLLDFLHNWDLVGVFNFKSFKLFYLSIKIDKAANYS